MDWTLVIDRNAAALRRIVTALAVMAGLGALPRHLHRAILRLLRPAESAARRLVVIAARDILAPRPCLSTPGPPPPWTVLRQRHCAPVAPVAAPAVSPTARRGSLRLPLLDPLPRLARPYAKLRGPGSSGVPRILFPGVSTPHPVAPWQPPSPDDRLDATRLRLRISAIGAALDDLPGEARRFARWRARRDAALATGTRHRLSPLRPGRPPGVSRRRARHPGHEVDGVAVDLHHFAREALKAPDTS